MQLVYYRGRTPNFGDDLNAFIWKGLLPDLFDDHSDIGFVGIGTIIGMPCADFRRLYVFSSGMGNDPVDGWRGRDVRYRCLRGPLSARLLRLGRDVEITDGAILTPLVAGFPSAKGGETGTLVIPHWQTLDHCGWQEATEQAGFELVDPRAGPGEVAARIAAARLVLTESLHGAILADTYGVPWHAFATSKSFAITKWVDWAMSVECSFEVTMVPPPDAGPILAFGRPYAPYGRTVGVDAEQALQEFHRRFTPPPRTLRSGLKRVAKQLVGRMHGPLSGFGPARTATALQRLAQAEPKLSNRAVRERLQGRMLERLTVLSAEA
jgi:succinoglycan biosynthesis protein ExoV